MEFDFSKLPSRSNLIAKYFTHSGLASQSRIELALPAENRIEVLNKQFMSDGKLDVKSNNGVVFDDEPLSIYVPKSIKEFKVNGRKYQNISPKMQIDMLPSTSIVENFSVKAPDSKIYTSLSQLPSVKGPHKLQFKLPKNCNNESTLVMSGLGSTFINMSSEGSAQKVRVHPYRDSLIPVSYTHLTLPTICSV